MTTAIAPVLTSTALPPEPRHARGRVRSRLDPYPLSATFRWGLRAGLSIPFIAAVLLIHLVGQPVAGTPNALLVERVSTIDWSRADPSFIGQLFPPITTLIAALVPGGRLGLALVGAVIAGTFLQKLIEIMVQRRFHRSTAIILMIALAANPLFFYAATEDLSSFLGIIFFGLAIANVVRFVSWSNTQSGFRAGLLFMLCALSDASGVVSVLAAALTVPFIRLGRAGQRGARWSNLLVVIFPTAASLAAIGFLNWAFVGSPFGDLATTMFTSVGDRLQTVLGLVGTLDGWLLVLPVLSAWLCAVIVGRWKSIPVSTLVFAALVLASLLGLEPIDSIGTNFITMTMLAMALMPRARWLGTNLLLDLVAVGQIGIAWFITLGSPFVIAWLGSLALSVAAAIGG